MSNQSAGKSMISLIGILLLLTIFSFAQQVTFRNMFPNESFNSVANITQDPKGNIWFTTRSGLTTYNGYSLNYYRHDPKNPNSLAGLRAECVYADKEGIIWIGFVGDGLDKFDPSTGIFTHYRHNPKDSSSIGHDIVIALLEDKDGNFWVGTHGGLDKMDKKTGRFTHFVHKDDDPGSLSNNQVRTIYQDREGTLWIGTGSAWVFTGDLPGEAFIKGEGGLNKMDMKTNKFTRYLNDPKNPNTLINNKVRAIFEDKEGRFWVGTAGDGLHIMDRKTGRFQRYTYDPKHPEKLSRPALGKNSPSDHITFITQDVSGAIWIGTLYGGLSRYDEQTKTIKHYITKDSVSGFNGAEERVSGHFISRDGLLWITGLRGNIYTISPDPVKIPYTKQGVSPYAFYLYKDSSLYMGTETGLMKKDLKNSSVKLFPVKEAIVHFNKDNNNNLWIAAYGSGVYKLNLQTETFTRYRHINGAINSLVNDSVNTVYVDREQNTWIGTENGLDRLNSKTDTFQHFLHNPDDSNSISSNEILCLMADRNEHLWIGYGNAGGIDKMDIKTAKCKNYLGGDYIYSITESSDGTIWIGSFNNGLYRYDEKADNCVPVLNPLNGKPLPSIISITEDQQNNLWLMSSTGLIKFNAKNNELSVFGKDAGVDPNALNIFAGYKDNTGRLYFGDTAGYYSFNPKDIQTQIKPPEIAFTRFSLGNEEVKAGPNSALATEIWKTKAIELKFNQNVFSFEYTLVDYNNPLENKSLYKLEKYDNEWRIATNPARAYYFNVPPGKYIFHVKACNSLGVWTDKSIAVTITPPWWRTWWAYTLFAVLFVGAIWAFISYRSKALRRENRILEEKVAHRTSQLKQSLENLKSTQAQLIQSEKMASLGELTVGIAHEIQNPLNFVNNFSEVSVELGEELKEELKKTELAINEKENLGKIVDDIVQNQQKINHHGKRADAIVKGMLQHSRVSSGKKEPADINALADEYLRLSYHGMRAKDKDFNATIQTDFDKTIEKINIVPQDIGRVLLNLYNNAFYAVKPPNPLKGKHYEPTVSINTRRIYSPAPGGVGGIEIIVKDNGKGIPQNVVDKIFQPFFTTKPTGQGTGLGLSLSYDIIKTHGGEIKVDTKEGEGTTFIIQLPIV
ncbi:MAG: two-component regulator propeller domain-containing protein [Ginsengibacter sp.]